MKRLICFFLNHKWKYVSILRYGKHSFIKHCKRCGIEREINQGQYMDGKTSIFKS